MVLLLIPIAASGQRMAVATDMVGYADMATLNGELSVSLAQHWSATAGFRYNPFTFKDKSGDPVTNRQRAAAVGARYWPWHVFSGWWFAAKAQYQEFNRGGIKSPQTREGDRYGAGVSAGFTYMIASWLNLELSLGTWGGVEAYKVYECPVCGDMKQQGQKSFLLPNDVGLAFSFVF